MDEARDELQRPVNHSRRKGKRWESGPLTRSKPYSKRRPRFIYFSIGDTSRAAKAALRPKSQAESAQLDAKTLSKAANRQRRRLDTLR